MKRVFIIHGWGGWSEEGWFPWLKKELEKRSVEVHVPAMPDTDKPKIETWVPHLKKLVHKADADTYFVGHSIGCQTILRYLERLNPLTKIGGIILVAPWIHLDQETLREEGEEALAIAKPWTETPINFKKVQQLTEKTVCIFSDNDSYVPLTESEFFKQQMNAKTIIEPDKGHFSGSDKITKIPAVLKELLTMMQHV